MTSRFESARVAGLRSLWQRARGSSPHWREVLPELSPSAIDLAALERLPVLTRDEARRLGTKVRTRSGLPDFFAFSGGTSGPSFRVHRAMIKDLAPPRPGVARPLWMMPEGSPSGRIPGQNCMIQVPMRDRAAMLRAIGLLLEEHAFEGHEPRISGLMITLPLLKRLVHVLREEGVHPEQLAVRSILTFGYHLTHRWREEILETLPGVAIDVFFGCSESPARVLRCRECGSYHAAGDVIWEVVDPGTGAPVHDGPGRLVLTSLQDADTTLIRYAPGDMVVRTPRCALSGEEGFRFAGREFQMHPLRTADGAVYPVHPVHVQEAVDTVEWIARYHPQRYRGITHTDGSGSPKWRIEPNAGRIRVELELGYDPALFTEAWARHRAEVVADLRAQTAHPELFDQQVDVVGLRTGTLAPADIDLC